MESIQQFTEQEAKEWAAFVTAQMANNMRRKGLTVTEKTLRSIYYDVKAVGQAGARIDIGFDSVGRFIEMNQSKGNRGRDRLENLKEWVKRKGVDSFTKIPGYDKKRLNLNDEAIIQRIALGIMFNPKADLSGAAVRGSKTKADRIWWSNALYGSISNLYGRLMYKYGLAAADSLSPLKGKN